MRHSLLLISCTAALLSAAEQTSLSGRWKIEIDIAGNESQLACALTQKGSDLSGDCTSDKGDVKLSGKVDGKKVSWSYQSEYNGAPLTVKYDGTLESTTKITGSVDVPEYGAQGEFVATQAN